MANVVGCARLCVPAALDWLCFAKPSLAGHDRARRAGGHASPVTATVGRLGRLRLLHATSLSTLRERHAHRPVCNVVAGVI